MSKMKELYTSLCEDIDSVLTEHLNDYVFMDEDNKEIVVNDLVEVFDIYLKNMGIVTAKEEKDGV